MPLPRPNRAWFLIPLMLAAGIGAAGAQPARAPGIAVLAKIEPGEWLLRDRSDLSATPRGQCVAEASDLLQLRHPGVACSRYVIDNQDRSTTVHYTCPGAGHGRTTVQLSPARVLRIDSQGIADNSPFNFSVEGRRGGACPTKSAASR